MIRRALSAHAPTYEWNFDNTVAPTQGAVTLSGTATFDGNGALTHNGTVPLVLSSGISLASGDDWSVCLIYREHGTDGSGFSYPLVSSDDLGIPVAYTNSSAESDGSVTSFEWNNTSGSDGDVFNSDIGLADTNINIWVKLLITNTSGNVTFTADGSTFKTVTNAQTPLTLTSILAREGSGSQNFEGDFAYLAIDTTVQVWDDYPAPADLSQTGL
ncbi:MAG: hypothetical protein HRT86_10330 [Ilumatobacteraceae bacterium]|nr:hypothetical protein [Ilumatobacteraceae bacterium]